MATKRPSFLADPVHRGIELGRLERALIDTPSFQRLRNIKQLGLAHLVYPSATHSRFSHSLGVYNIAQTAIDLLSDAHGWKPKDALKLRAAALLHDVGHLPYSHLLEPLLKDRVDFPLLEQGPTGRKFDHEEFGQLIVTKRDDIQRVLARSPFRLDPDEIASIMRGEHKSRDLNKLLHSTLDFDRMDYLVRDSMGTGIPLGQVDVPYLLQAMRVDKTKGVYFPFKAIPAIEQLVLARYLMSRAVYFHKTIQGFEALLRAIATDLIERGEVFAEFSTKSDVVKFVRDDERFLAFHDAVIDTAVRVRSGSATKGSVVWHLCRAFLARERPCLVRSASTIRGTVEQKETRAYYNLKRFRRDGLSAAATKSGIRKGCWFVEETRPVRFEGVSATVPLDQAMSPDELDRSKLLELVNVQDEDGREIRPLVSTPSSLLHHLGGYEFQSIRVFVVEQDEKKVRKARKILDGWCRE